MAPTLCQADYLVLTRAHFLQERATSSAECDRASSIPDKIPPSFGRKTLDKIQSAHLSLSPESFPLVGALR